MRHDNAGVVLDGNAAAGILSEIFVGDVTTVVGKCGGCGAIAALAEAYAKPLAPHDCTGPVTLMAGLHLAIHAPTAIFQEVVRATLSTWYRDLVTDLPVIRGGLARAPEAPGIGTRLHPQVQARDDARIRQSGVPRPR